MVDKAFQDEALRSEKVYSPHGDDAAKEGRANGKAPRFRLVPFDQIEVGTRRRDLIEDWIPADGLTVVWGPPKCGKSFQIFTMSMHVALGWEYRGRRVRSGPVVYCALEGQGKFGRRVEAFRRERLSEDGEPVPFHLMPATLDLIRDHRGLIEDIRSQLGAAAPAMVAIDTLNRSLAGSENDPKDMADYVRAADAIREAFQCSVVVIHHCGVDGSRPRGHTALTGAADVQIKVTRDKAKNVVAEVERSKDGPEGHSIVSALRVVTVGTDEDGENITSCVLDPVEAGPDEPRKVKLSGKTKIALDALHKALADAGQSGTSSHVPAGTPSVPLSLWKTYFAKSGGTDSDVPSTVRRTFNRQRENLQNYGLIDVWGDEVWLTEKGGT